MKRLFLIVSFLAASNSFATSHYSGRITDINAENGTMQIFLKNPSVWHSGERFDQCIHSNGKAYFFLNVKDDAFSKTLQTGIWAAYTSGKKVTIPQGKAGCILSTLRFEERHNS